MPTSPRLTRWRRTDRGFFGRAAEHARRRAKTAGVPCTITASDLQALWTGFCPAFGCPITMRDHPDSEYAAQLDRVSPRFGYVPGNVVFLSAKANRMKNNGTAQELRHIAAWMEAFHDSAVA